MKKETPPLAFLRVDFLPTEEGKVATRVARSQNATHQHSLIAASCLLHDLSSSMLRQELASKDPRPPTGKSHSQVCAEIADLLTQMSGASQAEG